MRRENEERRKRPEEGRPSRAAGILLILALLAGLLPAKGIALGSGEIATLWSSLVETQEKTSIEWVETSKEEGKSEEEWKENTSFAAETEGETSTASEEDSWETSTASEEDSWETEEAPEEEISEEEDTEWETEEESSEEAAEEETSEEETTEWETEEETTEEKTAEEETTEWETEEESTEEETTEEETSEEETAEEENSKAETTGEEAGGEETTGESVKEESSEGETTKEETPEDSVSQGEPPVQESTRAETQTESPAEETQPATEAPVTEAPKPTSPEKKHEPTRSEKPKKETRARSEPTEMAEAEEIPPEPELPAEPEPTQEPELPEEPEFLTVPETEMIPEFTTVPETTPEPDRGAPVLQLRAAGEGVHRGDVPVGVTVRDGMPSAGIREVSYAVTMEGRGTALQSGVLYRTKSRPEKAPRGESFWQGSLEVRADQLEGKVQVQVTVTDWAGYRTEQMLPLQIDTLAPRVELIFDNRDARNGSFYNRARRATLTVWEKNFSEELVDLELAGTGAEGLMEADTPDWSWDGEAHTAELVFDRDGEYEISVEAQDLAGNETMERISEVFTIDTEPGELLVQGVGDGEILGFSGGRSDPEATIRLQFGDAHFASYRLWLRRSRVLPDEGDPTGILLEENEDVSSLFLPETEGDAPGEITLRIPERDDRGRSNDGLYRLEAVIRDLAGNERREVLSFSVNRFGSVYVFEPSLYGLARDGGAYVQAVRQDLVLEEYNPNGLERAEAILLRDTEVEEHVLGSEEVLPTEEHESTRSWHRYTYRLAPEHFARDGVYRIRIHSVDRAAHQSENEQQRGCEILFRVDSTPPKLTDVKGMESAVVDADRLEIRLEAFDAIGLRSVAAQVNGVEVFREESFPDPVRWAGAFQLEQGKDQRVRLLLTDLAGNTLDTEARDARGFYTFLPAFPFERSITVRRQGLWEALINSFLPPEKEEPVHSKPKEEPELTEKTEPGAAHHRGRLVVLLFAGMAIAGAGVLVLRRRHDLRAPRRKRGEKT